MSRTPRRSSSSAQADRSTGPRRAGLFERTCEYVGFTAADSKLLGKLHPHVEPRIGEIVEDFYARIQRDPGAAKVITGGRQQVARLKGTLRLWLDRTLRGPHDADFAELQARIGRQHVHVGLEQVYMVTGMHVFREHLDRIHAEAYTAGDPDSEAVRQAYVRVLDVVLAIMLQAYREDSLRKILQMEQNARMRRLAALGEVAASIAHEVRNPLAGISGAIQILSQEKAATDPEQEILRAILGEIGRLDNRVNDLLLYARPSTARREPVHPHELIGTTLSVLGEDPLCGEIKVSMDVPADLPQILMDPDQIQQVLVNLVLNAMQALDGSGRIRIEARMAPAGALEVAVEDSGPGVPAEKAEEIFRPFYTTRPDGTGLGLSISRKIVESHGGMLDLKPGKNGLSRFVFLIPPPPDEGLNHTLLG